MEFTPLEIPDVVLIRPRVFGNARGWFIETWQEEKFAAAGLSPRSRPPVTPARLAVPAV